ncbi:hypothetical protein F5Y16DRAFT_125401 [Xylariaceae sp. FL0255]|nr:hypothetical protein F5Y16DRAFT_125401 [Xylariaceae sp. FL0255]
MSLGTHTTARPYHHHRSSISPRQTARLRQIVVISVLCLAVYCFLLTPEKSLDSSRSTNPEAYDSSSRPSTQHDRGKNRYPAEEDWESRPPPGPEILQNRFLSEEQCRANFPGLLKEVDDEVARGTFRLERNPFNRGPLVARIRDGQLYILLAARKTEMSADMLAHRSATLHQIANALLTWPSPSSSSPSSSSSSKGPYTHIPDTLLAFNHHDDPVPTTLSYARPADPNLLHETNNRAQPIKSSSGETKLRRFFAIPHFGFYAWDIPFVGSLSSAAKRITALEATTPFLSKIPKAVWRGTTWFNSPHAGPMRGYLVEAFGTEFDPSDRSKILKEGAPWADIQALSWIDSGKNASNALNIADFCRYKYIVFTEGITYSGRFHYHTLCESVVLTPPLAWMQHVTHLVRPVFSYALDVAGPDLDAPPPPSAGSFSYEMSDSTLLSLSSSSPPPATRKRSFFSTFFTSSPTGSEKKGDLKTSQTGGLPRTPLNLGNNRKGPSLAPYPARWVNSAWPTSYTPQDGGNMVFVAPDWSDLEATISWLESHPNAAATIAANQRALFHGRGYLSPAAEKCYWRGVIKGWSEVVRFDEEAFADLEEVPWEAFSLKEIHL